nr:hypothetical protein [Tanacetum cinerariifolium]
MLQARENLMEAIQAFLKKYDQIPSEEKCIALFRAEEKFLKDHDPPQFFISLEDDNDDDNYDKEKDEDINTIPKKELDEENKSSVENLFYIPSESKVTFDNESECDLPIFDDFSSLYDSKDDYVIFSRPLFDSYDDTTSSEYSSDNESILKEDVFSNLPFEFDEESISSDVNLVYDEDSDSFMEEIDSFLASDDPIPPGIDSDSHDSEEDNLFLKYETDPGELTRVFMEYIFREPRVHMPNVFPTHPTLCQDLDLTLSIDFSGSDLVVSFPSRNRNKTFDLEISIEVQSKRFLSLNKFSNSFISDPPSLVLETLLIFSSENEDKVFNPGILVSKEEKSPHLLSHRGFTAYKIIHNFCNESTIMIYGGYIPIWDISYLHFYPP